MKKTVVLILILVINVLLIGCKNDSVGLKYEKIAADHLISSDGVSSYMTVISKKTDGDMYYSLTVYSDFLKGTSRYYNYYQVDYLTDDGIKQYYHNFVFEDADKRKYAQNFLPYQKIDEIKSFDVLFSYEYKENEEVIKNDLKYHEEILKLTEEEKKLISKFSEFNFYVDTKVIDENNIGYKINLDINDIETGHLDFQTWIETGDGDILPFYGVYHYQTERGNYKDVGYEKLDINTKIKKMYLKIEHYSENNNKKVYILQYDII